MMFGPMDGIFKLIYVYQIKVLESQKTFENIVFLHKLFLSDIDVFELFYRAVKDCKIIQTHHFCQF